MSLSVPYAAMEPVVYTRYKHHSRDFLWRKSSLRPSSVCNVFGPLDERRIQIIRQPRLPYCLGTTMTGATVILTKVRTVFVSNYPVHMGADSIY